MYDLDKIEQLCRIEGFVRFHPKLHKIHEHVMTELEAHANGERPQYPTPDLLEHHEVEQIDE